MSAPSDPGRNTIPQYSSGNALEMAEFKSGARKIQGDPEIACWARARKC